MKKSSSENRFNGFLFLTNETSQEGIALSPHILRATYSEKVQTFSQPLTPLSGGKGETVKTVHSPRERRSTWLKPGVNETARCYC
jgi:hypothetical protein